jgi:hypothetical protein
MVRVSLRETKFYIRLFYELADKIDKALVHASKIWPGVPGHYKAIGS